MLADPRVQAIAPERYLVFAAPDGSWSWAFALSPLDGGRTRFLSRNRWPMSGNLGQRLAMGFMELGSLVMERKMLRGIKQRAERSHVADQ